ncbi:hypothetical protein ZWY2020_028026 [Hordeum vulgare]|nr:hypothetical protein ZWY2020_028026 [Hordeum vulgare]
MTTRSLNASASKSSASKRQKNFSNVEDLTLVDAYLEITQDPIIGVDQTRDCYWKIIEAYFHANKSEDHGQTVNRFCACYSQFLNRNQSGMTRDNKMELEAEKIRIMRMTEERMMAAEESKIMSMDLSGMDEEE